MLWDLYCRVVDNLGDVGTCWRLAADLAARGERVRLWIDDASALAWMAPHGAEGVTVRAWPSDAVARCGDVVVEAFGCALPPAVIEAIAKAMAPPVWLNLEHLSAEGYVERAHRLPSPQPGGLVKHFFYPGFTPRTGGLIRERGLAARQERFDAVAWLAARGLTRNADERVVSLFCYRPAAVPALLDRLAERPTLLLATAGSAAAQVTHALGPRLVRGALRAAVLPPLTQPDFDHLLWAGDLNFVRGEDSFVRAQWAGRPFVWQAYPQQGGVHGAKVEAFLDRFLAPERVAGEQAREPALPPAVRALWRAWNDDDAMVALPAWPPDTPWRERCHAWREALGRQADLTAQLIAFAAERLRGSR